MTHPPGAMFANAKPGDQVQLSAASPHARGGLFRDGDTRDPSRPVRAAVITHRWHDTVDDKEYLGLAIIPRGGEVGKPTIKHTIRGLASAGWRPATTDWIAYAKAIEAGEVVSIWKDRRK